MIPILESGKRSNDDPKAGAGIGAPGDPMFTLGTDSRHAIATGHLSGTLTGSMGRRRGQPNDDNPADYLVAYGGNNTSGSIDVATALSAHGGTGRMDFESEVFIAGTLLGEGFDAGSDGRCQPQAGDPCHPLAAGAHPPAIAFDCKAGGNTGFSVGTTAGSLRGDGHGGGHAAVAFGISSNAVDRQGEGVGGTAAERSGLGVVEECQPALRARPNNSVATLAFSGRVRGDDGRGYDRAPNTSVERVGALDTVKPWNVATGAAVRRLLPVECEALQGFPRDYTNISYRNKPAADGPRYKALGNSQSVPVMRWILSRIEFASAGVRHIPQAAE